jgi:hypothetical protein
VSSFRFQLGVKDGFFVEYQESRDVLSESRNEGAALPLFVDLKWEEVPKCFQNLVSKRQFDRNSSEV